MNGYLVHYRFDRRETSFQLTLLSDGRFTSLISKVSYNLIKRFDTHSCLNFSAVEYCLNQFKESKQLRFLCILACVSCTASFPSYVISFDGWHLGIFTFFKTFFQVLLILQWCLDFYQIFCSFSARYSMVIFSRGNGLFQT